MTNISIISACNNNCSYCFQKDSYHKQPDMLEFDEILKIFEWSKGSQRMGILGGEATLHPECLRICRASVSRFNTIFFTNLLCDSQLLVDLLKLDMVWLINTNSRPELLNLFDDNMSLLEQSRNLHKFTFGITLVGNPNEDIKYIKNLFRLSKKYPDLVQCYRIALATPTCDRKYKLINFDESLKLFYDVLNKENDKRTVAYDCSVNYCQISPKLMQYIINDSRTAGLKSKCGDVRIDIMADRSINFCGSTPSEIFSELKDYRMFGNWVECANYIQNFVVNYMKRHAFSCKYTHICNNKDCHGPCFALTASLVKEERNKPLYIQKFNSFRKNFLN